MNKTYRPGVTVLIPLYNAEKYIKACLESLCRQTFTDFEVIICNDCSTDNSVSIVEQFLLSHTQLNCSLIHNNKNSGVAFTRNRLLEAVTTNYIVWQDADDIAKTNRIESLKSFMDSHPFVGMCGSSLEIFDSQGSITYRHYPLSDTAIRSLIYRFVPLAQPAAIARTEVYFQAGLFDPTLRTGEDLDILFRIGNITQLANLITPLLEYRDHQSITAQRLVEMEKNTLAIRKKYKSLSTYKYRVHDYLFNLLHYLSLFFIPSSIKIKLFQFIRDRKSTVK